MKALRLIFVIACLSLYALVVFAQAKKGVRPDDFFNRRPLGMMACEYRGKAHECFVMEKDDTVYLLVGAGADGVKIIYSIQQFFPPNTFKEVWAWDKEV